MNTPIIGLKQKPRLPIWKPLVLSGGMVLLARILHLWIPDNAAWAISAFVSVFLFYELPPRIGSSWTNSALWSLMSALLVFTLSLVI